MHIDYHQPLHLIYAGPPTIINDPTSTVLFRMKTIQMDYTLNRKYHLESVSLPKHHQRKCTQP